MEVCVGILVLLIAVPMLFKLLGAMFRVLGPLIAVAIAVAIVLGVVVLAVNLVGSVISTAVNLLFGPLGLLLVGGTAAYFGYQWWKKRQYPSVPHSTRVWDAKPKRGEPSIEIGDDGEIVTLDELMDDEPEKRKRQ